MGYDHWGHSRPGVTKIKKALRQLQTLHTSCIGGAKKISPAADPLPGGTGRQNLISWRWSLLLRTNPLWWRSMQAISSYCGNGPTNTPTHKQIHRQDWLQYTAPQLARSVISLLTGLKHIDPDNFIQIFPNFISYYEPKRTRTCHDPRPQELTIWQKKWKSAQRRKHCTLAVGLCSKAGPKISAQGRAGRPKFNQLEMVTTFTYWLSLVKVDVCNFELSCFFLVTHTQTNPQTGPITILNLAHSVISIWRAK